MNPATKSAYNALKKHLAEVGDTIGVVLADKFRAAVWYETEVLYLPQQKLDEHFAQNEATFTRLLQGGCSEEDLYEIILVRLRRDNKGARETPCREAIAKLARSLRPEEPEPEQATLADDSDESILD